MARELDLEDFLKHSSSDRSGGFLDRWKKNNPPRIDVFLARKPIALWQHGLPTVKIIEDKKTGRTERRVWTGDYNCHEDEAILQKQYRRDDDDDREEPPRRCALCKLVEWARTIDMFTKVFKFEGDRPDETRIVRAGHLYNGFQEDRMDEEQVERFRKMGLKFSDAWSLNAYAKLKYLFCVVDASNPAAGVQMTKETGLLGDKVKDVINDAIESLGEEEGNPFLHPYAIQWEFREKEKDLKKKYHARRMEKVPVTDAILKLLKSGKDLDVKGVTAPFNSKALRATLEHACLLKGDDAPPWDELFAKSAPGGDDEEEPRKPAAKKATRNKPAEDDEVEEPKKPAAKKATRNKPEPEPEEEEGEEEGEEEDDDEVACDDCEKAMKADATECPHCGAEYDVKTGKKIASGGKKPAAKKATRRRSAAAETAPAEGDDEIPF